MFRLAYMIEDEKYPQLSEEKISDEHAERIVKKVSRHFKLNANHVVFKNLRTHGGLASKMWNTITMIHNPNLLIIAHELNHFMLWKKYPRRKVNHGTKKWFWNLKRIINYCEKKNWWREEEKRLTEQSQKTQEKQLGQEAYKKTSQYKVEQIQKSIKKWESKKKRAENALKRLDRRKKIWEKKLNLA
jgi:hypothetical protein